MMDKTLQEFSRVITSKVHYVKSPNTEFFSGPYFPIFGPEKTPHLDTFHK